MARLMRMPVRICGLAAGSTSSRKVCSVVRPRVRAVSNCTAVDSAHAAIGVKQDRKQGGEEDQRNLHLVADADE